MGEGGPSGAGEDKARERLSGRDADIECQYALLQFEKPVTSVPDAIVIGSRLDTDVHILLCSHSLSYCYAFRPLESLAPYT